MNSILHPSTDRNHSDHTPAAAPLATDLKLVLGDKGASTDGQLFNVEEFIAFIDRGASALTPRSVHRLVAELPEVREKFAAVGEAGLLETVAQLEFLANTLESFGLHQDLDLPYRAALDGAFALLYFHRDIDLIPDSLGAIGYVDDAAVVSTVLLKHADAFSAAAERLKQDWIALGVEKAVS